MKLGDLRHRVFLQMSTLSPDGSGTATETWGALSTSESEPLDDGSSERGTTAWCAIEPAGARDVEQVFGAALQAPLSHLVTLRYRSDVTSKMRIRWLRNTTWRTLAIRGLQEEGGRGRWLILACEERT